MAVAVAVAVADDVGLPADESYVHVWMIGVVGLLHLAWSCPLACPGVLAGTLCQLQAVNLHMCTHCIERQGIGVVNALEIRLQRRQCQCLHLLVHSRRLPSALSGISLPVILALDFHQLSQGQHSCLSVQSLVLLVTPVQLLALVFAVRYAIHCLYNG